MWKPANEEDQDEEGEDKEDEEEEDDGDDEEEIIKGVFHQQHRNSQELPLTYFRMLLSLLRL